MLDSRHIIGPGFTAMDANVLELLATTQQPSGDDNPAMGKIGSKTSCI